nr:MAG TPA: portal protein [Caudoviricetes sp.]
MNWVDRVKRWFGGLFQNGGSDEELFRAADDIRTELYVRELAFWTNVNLIANAVSKCEFKTYSGGKEIKGHEYYLWNIEPNRNQCSSDFIRKLVSKLYTDNEVLVIEHNSQLVIADSFIRKEYVLYDDVFSQVQVGDFVFNETFLQKDVIYMTLFETNLKMLVNGIYEAYKKLIAYGVKSYQRSRGSRGVINVSTMAQGDKDFSEKFNKLMQKDFKSFFEADNAVLPLFDGYSYTELDSKRTYTKENTRDIKAMIDDIYEVTAKAFQVPPALTSGKVAGVDDAMDMFLTACIDPLTDRISEEINRKRYGYSEYSRGNYLKIDTKAVKHIDLLSVAQGIDKLISSGSFTINDIHNIVGEPLIDEEWANQHFLTKNYEPIQDFLKLSDSKGGEKQ